jgi:hypothetical protein
MDMICRHGDGHLVVVAFLSSLIAPAQVMEDLAA